MMISSQQTQGNAQQSSPLPLPLASATVTAVKGHLVTKSSALSIGGCKLEKQFLTAQNMASHYKRVIGAKASIDTNPPKSMVTSQKARDRAKREMAKFECTTGSGGLLQRTQSAEPTTMSARQLRESQNLEQQQQQQKEQRLSRTVPAPYQGTKSARTLRIDEMKPRTLPNRAALHQEMSTLMAQFTRHPAASSRVKLYAPMASASSASPSTSQSARRPPIGGVDLTSRSHSSFKALNSNRNSIVAESFRTVSAASSINHPALKATSRLVASHNYDVLDLHADQFKQPSHDFEPRIKNKENAQSQLVQKSACYQAPRRRRHSSTASSASAAKRADSALNQSVPAAKDNDNDVDDSAQDVHCQPQQKQIENSSAPLNTSASRLNESTTSLKRAAEKEEELKYLEFIKQVTDDIIARGISSNRVINNCFEYHIKKCRGRLDERKMRDLMLTLRADIGMPPDNDEANSVEAAARYHETVNRALLLDNQNKAATTDTDTNKDDGESSAADYMTLRTFGWLAKSNESGNGRAAIKSSNRSSPTGTDSAGHSTNAPATSTKTAMASSTAGLFDTYENQIIRNIQSIRRSSLSKSSNSSNSGSGGHNSRRASDDKSGINESSAALSVNAKAAAPMIDHDGRRRSDLNRTNSMEQSEAVATNAAERVHKATANNAASLSNHGNQKKGDRNDNGDEDDDDDDNARVFQTSASKSDGRRSSSTSASKSPLPNQRHLNQQQQQQHLQSKQNHKPATRGDYDDEDILFNDNYDGGGDQDDKKNDEEDNDDDDDDFGKLLKTKTLKKENLTRRRMDRQRSTSDKSNSPVPTPRRTTLQQRSVSSSSSLSRSPSPAERKLKQKQEGQPPPPPYVSTRAVKSTKSNDDDDDDDEF